MPTVKCTKCNTPKEKNRKHLWCKKCCSKASKDYSRTRSGLTTRIYGNQIRRSRIRGHAVPSYSRQQLHKWLASQGVFDELFRTWVNSGYDKMLTPSCDRLDDYKGYSFDNIRLTTWKENKAKGWLARRNGTNNKGSKSVSQLTLGGYFVSNHYSMRQAGRDVGVSHSDISQCCNGTRETAGGFKWKYAQQKSENEA